MKGREVPQDKFNRMDLICFEAIDLFHPICGGGRCIAHHFKEKYYIEKKKRKWLTLVRSF
jgi:hypothetical protein